MILKGFTNILGRLNPNYINMGRKNKLRIFKSGHYQYQTIKYIKYPFSSQFQHKKYLNTTSCICQFSSSKNQQTIENQLDSIKQFYNLYQEVNSVNKINNQNDLLITLNYYEQIISYMSQKQNTNYQITKDLQIKNKRVSQCKELIIKKYSQNSQNSSIGIGIDLSFLNKNYQKCVQFIKKQRLIVQNLFGLNSKQYSEAVFREGFIISVGLMQKALKKNQEKQVLQCIKIFKKFIQLRQSLFKKQSYDYQIAYSQIIISQLQLIQIYQRQQINKQTITKIKSIYQRTQQAFQKHIQNQIIKQQKQLNQTIYLAFCMSLQIVSIVSNFLLHQGENQYLLQKIIKGKRLIEKRIDNPKVRNVFLQLQKILRHIVVQSNLYGDVQQMVKFTQRYLQGTNDDNLTKNGQGSQNLTKKAQKQSSLIQIWFSWCLKVSQTTKNWQKISKIYQIIVELIKQWNVKNYQNLQIRRLMFRIARQYQNNHKRDEAVKVLIELCKQKQKRYFQQLMIQIIKTAPYFFLLHLGNQISIYELIKELNQKDRQSTADEKFSQQIDDLDMSKILKFLKHDIKLGVQIGLKQQVEQILQFKSHLPQLRQVVLQKQ